MDGPGWIPIEDTERPERRLLEAFGQRPGVALPEGEPRLRERPLPFYEGLFLVELAYRDNGFVARTFALCEEDSLAVRPLPFTSPTIHNANGERLRLEHDDPDETERRVLEYLRFFCFFIRGPEGPFFLADGAERFDWEEAVDPEIDKRFRPPRLVDRDDRGRWRIECTVVYGGALFDCVFEVAPEGLVEMVDDDPIRGDLPIRLPRLVDRRGLTWLTTLEPATAAGASEVDASAEAAAAESGTVSTAAADAEGRPRTALEAFFGRRHDSGERTPDARLGRETVEGDLRTAVIQRLNERLGSERVAPQRLVVRRLELPFYRNYDLFEIERRRDKPIRTYLLWTAPADEEEGEREAIFLDLSANSIRKVPAGELRLAGDTEEATRAHVAAYLKFFCRFSHGEGGPFYIVEREGDIPWRASRSQGLAFEIEGMTHHPIELPAAGTSSTDGETETDEEAPGDVFGVEATLLYQDALFRARFRVREDGRVDMESDQRLVGGLEVRRTGFDHAPLVGSVDAPAGGVTWTYLLEPASREELIRKLKAGHRASFLFVDEPVYVGMHAEIGALRETVNVAAAGSRDPGGDGDRPVAESDPPESPGDKPERRLEAADNLAQPIRIERCVLLAGLSLNDVRCESSVKFDRCEIRDFAPNDPDPGKDFGPASERPVWEGPIRGFEFEGARVEGSLELVGCRVHGSLIGDRARIEGDLNLQGLRLAHGTTKRGSRISVRQAAIEGSISLLGAAASGYASLVGSEIRRNLQLTGLRLSGYLSVQQCVIGGNVETGLPFQAQFDSDKPGRAGAWLQAVQALRTRVQGNLYLGQIRVGGVIDLTGVEVGHGLHLSFARAHALFCRTTDKCPLPPRIGGDVAIGGLQVDSHVEFTGVEIGGALYGISARMGAFYVDRGLRPVADAPSESGADGEGEGPFELVGAAIGQSIFLRYCTIEGPCLLRGLRVRERGGEVAPAATGERIDPNLERALGSVVFDHCAIDGEWTICGLDALETLPRGTRLPAERSSFVEDRIDLFGCEINGPLDLRALEVGRTIRLERATVRGDVRCGALPSASELARRAPLPAEVPTANGPWTTACSALDIERLVCIGDVDLTGLLMSERNGGGAPRRRDDLGGDRSGSLNARRCRIEGRLRLCHYSDGGRRRGSHATVPGDLILTAANVSHLILSGHSFVETGHADGGAAAGGALETSSDRISLERAAIDRFQIFDPLPCRLDLRSLEVRWWNVEGSRFSRLEVFEHLLRQDQYKERGTFHEIERSLLREGHTDEAEQVRQWLWNCERGGTKMPVERPERGGEMQERDRKRRRPGPVRWLWCAFWEQFGYGRPAWLLGFAVASVLLMTLLLAEPDNIRRSLGAAEAFGPRRGAAADVCGERHRPPAWGPLDAFWVSFRHHVPMLTIRARDEWRPSPCELRVRLGAGPRALAVRTAAGTFTAEDYAAVVSTLAWPWWALLLLSATGVMRRVGLGS